LTGKIYIPYGSRKSLYQNTRHEYLHVFLRIQSDNLYGDVVASGSTFSCVWLRISPWINRPRRFSLHGHANFQRGQKATNAQEKHKQTLVTQAHGDVDSFLFLFFEICGMLSLILKPKRC